MTQVNVSDDITKVVKPTKAERKAKKKETQAKLDAIKKEINQTAEVALEKGLPQKIIELNALIKQLPGMLTDIAKPSQEIKVNIVEPPAAPTEEASSAAAPAEDASSAEPPQKKRKLNEGTLEYSTSVGVWRKKAPRTEAEVARIQSHVQCHPVISEVTNILKKMLMGMVELVSTLKISISLRIPRMEDGNNFGVGVQEECLGELGSAEDTAFSHYDKLTKYFQLRAKLVSKVLKWPYIEDYRDAVRELDEKQAVALKNTAEEIRQNYLVLWDLINKNINKIKNPRNQHTSMIY